MALEQIQLIPTLRARWRRVVMTWLAVVVAVLAVSLALPPRYQATSQVAVEMAGVDPIGGQAVFKPAGSVSTHIATQADILRSEEVALGVVRSLGLAQGEPWLERWRGATEGRGDPDSWIAGELLRRLEVRPARDSNVLTVAYTSPDPDFSAAVANAFVRSFVETTVRMQVAPAQRFNTFFAERAKPLREALDKARANLSAYEKEHGIIVGADADPESARLAELNSQLVQLQDAAAEASNMRRQARSAPGEMREVRNDPEVAVLTGDLARLQGQLAELTSEFGERHHAVVQARQSIADARRRLDGATRRAAESLGVPSRVLDARLLEVRRAIGEQQTLVLKRKSQRDAATALLRDVENAEKAYGAVLTRASQTALESANTNQTSVSILKAATPPLWSPGYLVRNVLIALIVGLLLGIARALLAENRDRRLRTFHDVTDLLRQPLLLALPDGDARRRGRRSDQTRQRLVAVQPRLSVMP